MKLVADDRKFNGWGQVEQAFDYADPANHNGDTMRLKTIGSGGKKYIVSRR